MAAKTMSRIDPVQLTAELIRFPSVTPQDAGAIPHLAHALEALGFGCEKLEFAEPGTDKVLNLYARLGKSGRNFCFAGHTDVVPPGYHSGWASDPFAAERLDGAIIGRGAADMKGAIACFIAAAARLIAEGGADKLSISLLITGDEEGRAVDGTCRVLSWLAERGERLDACIVGEPSCPGTLGDTIKIGRRGSLNGTLRVLGSPGHSAYPELADNPLPRLLDMLKAITDEPLDLGSAAFQPSTLALTSIDVGNTATNVIPGQAEAKFNIRYNDRHTAGSLESWLRQRFDAVDGNYELDLDASSAPFVTAPGPLTSAMIGAIREVTGLTPVLNTSGGTSDARFIKAACPVAEFGPVNQTIHKADERVSLADLEALTVIYHHMLRDLPDSLC